MIDTVSFAEFAKLLSVSEPTLRKRIGDAPAEVVLRRGTNGDAYEIDPRAGVTWWRSIAAEVEAARLSRMASLEELQLELIGEDAALGGHDLGGLTPGEKKSQLEAELAAIKLGELRGELVRAADVEAAANRMMLAVKDKFESLTDRLRKRAEISEDVAAALDRLVQRDLHDLADVAASIEDEASAEEGVADRPAVSAGLDDLPLGVAFVAPEGGVDGQPVGRRQ